MEKIYFSELDSEDFLACQRTSASSAARATAVYLHGFMSDQNGEKAARFREELVACGIPCVTFDFRGHGASSGSMRDLTGTRLLEDLRLIDDRLCQATTKPVLIGSSMGGWVASWYAALHPARVAACILIAPAFHFGRLLCREAGEAGLRQWASSGRTEFSNEFGQVELGFDLIRDLERYRMDDLVAKLEAPSLIMHGVRDEAVDFRDSVDFVARSSNPDLELMLLGSGDHRLTAHKDLLARRTAVFLSEHGLI